MPTIEPVVRASVLSQYDRVVRALSVDPSELLVAVGLTAADIDEPERNISLNTVAELFEMTARRTGDMAFGLNYASAFPAGGSGVLGQLMLTAPTVGGVLKVLEEFFDVYATPMRARLENHGGIYSFLLGYPPAVTAPHTQYTAFLFAILVFRLRLGAGAAWTPYGVEFQHRSPEALKDYQRVFGNRLTFDAPRYRFDVEASDMEKPMPQLLDGLAKTVRSQAVHVLAEVRTRVDIVERTYISLYNRLENEEAFELDTIAAELQLPVRALQWRLGQAGTSYERQLARARRKLAVHLLRDTDLAMSVVAQRLGYSETSAFTRAAQGWFREAPSLLRRRLRADGPDAVLPDNDE